VKVILIEEARFPEVIDLMKARAEKIDRSYVGDASGLTDQQIKHVADAVFRALNYEFVRWAQSHGASCVR
jgi:hypothetical protein